MLRHFLRVLVLPVSIWISGCAGIDTGLYQGARPLPKGGVRLGLGLSSGLHLEEANHYKAAGREAPDWERPLYKRSLLPKTAQDLIYLTIPAAHIGIGLRDNVELNGSFWGGLLGQGLRLGIKRNVYQSGSGLYASLLPGIVFMRTEGGSSPEDEITDGQQLSAQYLIYDKAVGGLDLPLSIGFQKEDGREWYIAPSYSVYMLNVSKSYRPEMTGTYVAHRLGLAVGTDLMGDSNFLRPEISLSVLFFAHSYPVANVNFAIGFGFESDDPD